LVYHGTTLAEISRLTSYQLQWVYFRERDEQGRLVKQIRPVAADVVQKRKPVSFEEMFRGVKRFQGLDDAKTEEAWQQYIVENPSIRRHLRKK